MKQFTLLIVVLFVIVLLISCQDSENSDVVSDASYPAVLTDTGKIKAGHYNTCRWNQLQRLLGNG